MIEYDCPSELSLEFKIQDLLKRMPFAVALLDQTKLNSTQDRLLFLETLNKYFEPRDITPQPKLLMPSLKVAKFVLKVLPSTALVWEEFAGVSPGFYITPVETMLNCDMTWFRKEVALVVKAAIIITSVVDEDEI